MSQLNETLQSNLAVVVVAGAVAVFVLLVIAIVQAMRIRRVGRRLTALTRGAEGQSIEGVLAGHLDTVLRVNSDLDVVRARIAALEAGLPLAFQRVGLIRFNPFQDTGGNQSFALALLDGEDNGFVMSSLHSRTGTRVYAKAIKAGRCDTALSDEENQALDVARASATLPAAAVVKAAPRSTATPSVSDGTVRGSTPARATGARDAEPLRQARQVGVGAGSAPDGHEPMDGSFLERRLRGEDEEGSTRPIWGEPPRS